MHKTPSSPALSRLESDYLTDGGSVSGSGIGSPGSATAGRESLADLWQSFLEQESGSGSGGVSGNEKGMKSRTASQSTGVGGVLSPGLPTPGK